MGELVSGILAGVRLRMLELELGREFVQLGRPLVNGCLPPRTLRPAARPGLLRSGARRLGPVACPLRALGGSQRALLSGLL